MTSVGKFLCHIPVIGTISQSVLIINVLAALSENVNTESSAFLHIRGLEL